MADQNKPKIDLKARLGRKTVGEAGPSIPPPLATGASIPAPPFSSTPPAAQRPQGQSVPGYPGHTGQGGFGQSYPPAGFTPSTAPQAPVMAAPAAIKIEMGEEVIAAQKKGRSKVMMIAAGTAVVGMIIGYAIGGGSERRTRQNIALQGAELLSEEVDKANAETEK